MKMKKLKDNFKLNKEKLEIYREKINKDTFFIGFYKHYTCVGIMEKFKIKNYNIYNEKTPMLNMEILYIEEIRNIEIN